MTIVSNDPSLWPIISYFREASYMDVACLIIVVYDWALTFGQEFELVWRQRWSLMTFLYLSVRYIGIPYTTIIILTDHPSVPLTDTGCTILYVVSDWTSAIVNLMLNVIMVVRLYAMYQRSKRMLIFLVVTVLAVQITSGVIITILSTGYILGEEYVLSGTYSCDYGVLGDVMVLNLITWVLGTAWEALALCLAAWIAVKHFRELQQPSAGWTVDCFTILIKTHVFYFASFVAVSCLQLIEFSPKFSSSTAVAEEVVLDIVGLTQIVQMFILGPRLILGVREFHANLVANSDEGPGMTSIAFQERVHISTGSGV